MTAEKKSVKKLFVLDTNVILHDFRCIFSFSDNDVAIPITVLEELDQFKKGHNDLNFQARAFSRTLDGLTGDLLSSEGASLGPDLGRIRVVLGHRLNDRISSAFLADSPDHRIINAALVLGDAQLDTPVILVSKDTNVRLKAKAFGLRAQDYTRDKVESVEKLYTGKRTLEASPQTIDQLHGDHECSADLIPEIREPKANEYFILRNGSKSVLARNDAVEKVYRRVEKTKSYGIMPRNAEQTFALNALTDNGIQLVTLAGRAGTGKTILALAAALACRSSYRQIYLARPIVPLSNRDLGFLPGDVGAKLEPYMQPLHDNLTVIRQQFKETDADAQRIRKMLETEKLVITPLAYIRGRSLQRVFFIVDEAQNLNPHEVKTIITRAGEGTKIVFTGDIHQIDHPFLDSLSNGLSYLINRMVGQPIYSHITLKRGERSLLADLASELL